VDETPLGKEHELGWPVEGANRGDAQASIDGLYGMFRGTSSGGRCFGIGDGG